MRTLGNGLVARQSEERNEEKMDRIRQAAARLNELTAHVEHRRGLHRHMTGDHGWTVFSNEASDTATLQAMHRCAHLGEEQDRRAELDDAEDELSLGRPEPPGHSHHSGPLCGIWYSIIPSARGGCGHSTCMELVHENCPACQQEAMDETAGLIFPPQVRSMCDLLLAAGRCARDGSPLTCVGQYGAPGIGTAWECDHGHPWAMVAGIFHDPATSTVHILTEADVR